MGLLFAAITVFLRVIIIIIDSVLVMHCRRTAKVSTQCWALSTCHAQTYTCRPIAYANAYMQRLLLTAYNHSFSVSLFVLLTSDAQIDCTTFRLLH